MRFRDSPIFPYISGLGLSASKGQRHGPGPLSPARRSPSILGPPVRRRGDCDDRTHGPSGHKSLPRARDRGTVGLCDIEASNTSVAGSLELGSGGGCRLASSPGSRGYAAQPWQKSSEARAGRCAPCWPPRMRSGSISRWSRTGDQAGCARPPRDRASAQDRASRAQADPALAVSAAQEAGSIE